MKRLLFWVTILSGAGAAYLMFRRGVPLTTIAQDTLTHPVGSFAHEVQAAM
jgi:hypothetical protein